jgi:hypothetical protein
MGNGLLSERLRHLSVGALALAVTVLAGAAAAQDYDAGKTGPQMFASDCSACHNKPGGLAKGRDKGSLTSFLREHYTTKQESAALLAAYLLGAPATAEVKPDVPGGPKAKTRKAEREEEQKAAPKPEPKPRAEPARRSEEPAAEPREEPKRARADEPPKGTADPVLSKLKYYGSARGPAKDTAHLGNPGSRLESYANSGAATVTPDAGTHDTAAPAARRTTAQKKKKKDTDASASVAGGAPKPAHPPGNN